MYLTFLSNCLGVMGHFYILYLKLNLNKLDMLFKFVIDFNTTNLVSLLKV